MGPGLSRSGLSGPRGAGMTLVEVARDPHIRPPTAPCDLIGAIRMTWKCSTPCCALLPRPPRQGAMALEGDLGAGVGLLQLHAPIAQIGKGDRLAGDGAADEIAGRDDLKLAVEIAQSRLAPEAEQPLKPIHAPLPLAPCETSRCPPAADHDSANA